jgi:large conductance mechanosensitive channel
MRSTIKEFRSFVLRGNVVDLAIGVAIGAAFNSVISALTEGLLTPLLGNADAGLGDLEFRVAGRIFKYGLFLEAAITFLLSALLIFLFVVKPVNRLRRFFEGDVPTTASRQCPECRSNVPVDATRCAACTQPIPLAGATSA